MTADTITLGLDDDGAPVTLDRATRNKHLYLIGKSRTGKTTLMLNLMRADLAAGDGLTFIDPAGDAAHQLLGYVPNSRQSDVIFFDPTRADCPALNLLALPYDRDKLAQEIVSAFRLFFDSWGPRMGMLLRNGLVALLDDRVNEPHSLADLERLYIEERYRERIAARATDPRVKRFLEDDLPHYERSALDPVLNKLDAFLSTRLLARLFGATTNALDFDQLLNRRSVLVCSLSKGKIGEEPAKFLGGLIVAALTVAALARADRPPSERADHFLYVDEFQNFAVASFATIFAEAAKYRLNLTVAHQTRAQLTPEIHAAIGNASTFIVFRISADDAAALSRELRTKRHVWKDTGAPYDHRAARETYIREEFARAGPTAARRAAEQQTWPPLPDDITETAWPDPDDIVNLENLHAFARIERPENTTAIAVPFPPDPSDTARAAVLAAQARRATEISAAEKNRPRKTAQEPRTQSDEGQGPHQLATTFDDNAGEAVHSPHDETAPPTHQPPTRRLPAPRRRA